MSRQLQRRQAWIAIAVAVSLSLLLPWLPYLHWARWPLLLGSTLAHELGHGLAALAIGGDFESLQMFGDGSGVASYRGHFSDIDIALVAASGLIGPPLCAFALLLAGRSARASHAGLGALALLLAAVALLWSGNTLTLVYCGALAVLLGLAAWRGPAQFSQILCLFMAVELALASFTRADYLFTASADTGQGRMLSDVGQIAAATWLPYWFWGGLIALLSIALLALGCWRFIAALR